jgi:sugar lactone lactonase YvrE
MVSHAMDEERILVHDLATGRHRTFAHPGGTDHSIGSAMPNDDMLVTASKNTVAVWDFSSFASHS